MAREVKRRGGPSYLILTIVFVFLFVVAATMLIMVYSDYEKSKQDRLRLEESIAAVISPSDEKEIAGMIAEIREKQAKKLPTGTVVANLRAQVKDLIVPLTNQPVTPETALKIADDVYANTLRKEVLGHPEKEDNARSPLPEELLTACMRVKTLEQEKKDEIAKVAAAQQQVDALKKDVEAYKSKYEAFVKEGEQKVTDLDAKGKQQFDTYQADLEKIKQANKLAVEEFEKKYAQALADLTGKDKENKDLKNIITSLNEKIQNLIRDRTSLQKKIQLVSVGKVLELGTTRMPDGTEICYIDHGTNDKVKNNMTFAVYSPKTLSDENPTSKAKLLVVDAQEKYSVCRIIEPRRDDPIAVGDSVINLVYDPIRSNSFVVCGDFDLLNTGRSSRTTEDYNRKLKQMTDYIKLSGGKLTDDVEVTTDFVVLGTEPLLPEAVDPSASEQTKQAYAKMKELQDKYNEIRVKAIRMGVPILNTTRFLAATGFVPTDE